MPSSDRSPTRGRQRLDRRRFLAVCGLAAVAGCGGSPGEETTTDRPTTTTSTTTSTATTSRTERTTTDRRSFSGTWPGYGYDLANTGHNTETTALDRDSVRWSKYVDGWRTLPAPAVSSTGIYIGSEHKLFGIVRSNGFGAWEEDLGAFTHQFTPTVDDGVVYGVARGIVGARTGSPYRGTVVAIDEVSGEVLWRESPYVSGSPTVVDGLVMYPTSRTATGGVEARSVTDGRTEWRYEFGDDSGSYGAPAYHDGVVYATGSIAGDRGRVAAITPEGGEEQWTYDIDTGIDRAPVVSEGAVVFADTDGSLHSVGIAEQRRHWVVPVGDGIFSRPAVTSERVFAVSRGTLTAVDRGSGTVDWTAPIGSSHFSTVSVADGVVYVGGPTLYAYNTGDGSLQWKRDIPGYAGAYGGPVVVNAEMFLGACVKQQSGDLYNNFVYKLA